MKRRTTAEPTTTLMSTSTSANSAPIWTALATAFTLVAVTTKTTTANSVGFFVSAADEQQQQQQLRGRSSSRNLWGREFNGNGAMQRQQQGRGRSGNSGSIIEGNGNPLQYQQHHGFSSLNDFDFDHAREHGDMTYNPGQSTLLIGRPVDLSFVHNSTDGNDIDTNHKLDMNPLAASSSSSGVPQTRIVGGQEDILGPYVMHLQFVDDDPTGKEPFWSFAGCGGTLISNCHVLTAAHCVQRSTRTDGVFIGAYKPFTQDNGGQKRSFSYLASSNVNPGFSNVDNSNDVAILTLETCVTGHEIIDVADNTFMSNNVVQGGLLTVAGFGQLAEADNTPVEALRSVDVGYIPGEQCNSYYPRQVLDDMICAGFPDLGGADSCQGDSGGPLYHTDSTTGKKTQVGVVSWGVGCGEKNYPGVYTSTAYHYDYIKEAVCSYPLTDPTISLCGGLTPNVNSGTEGRTQEQQQCVPLIGLPCDPDALPCCQSEAPLECRIVRGGFQCAAPARPERESIGQSSSAGGGRGEV